MSLKFWFVERWNYTRIARGLWRDGRMSTLDFCRSLLEIWFTSYSIGKIGDKWLGEGWYSIKKAPIWGAQEGVKVTLTIKADAQGQGVQDGDATCTTSVNHASFSDSCTTSTFFNSSDDPKIKRFETQPKGRKKRTGGNQQWNSKKHFRK